MFFVVAPCGLASGARRCGQTIFFENVRARSVIFGRFIQKCKFLSEKSKKKTIRKIPDDDFLFFLSIIALFFFALSRRRLDLVSPCLALFCGSSRYCLALVSGCLGFIL